MIELPYDLFAILTPVKRKTSACQRRVGQARIYRTVQMITMIDT